MGTCRASSNANLLRGGGGGGLEVKLLENSLEIPIFWLRYIDDIILIWTNGRPALETFITHANNFHHTIKLPTEI